MQDSTRTVPPVPDKRLIQRLRLQIGLLAISGTALVVVAVGWTAAVAAGRWTGALPIILVAVFAAEATFATLGMIVGIDNCRAEIRRARR